MITSLADPRRRHARGVTLIELVIVIVLVGIVSSMIAVFVGPVRAYLDSSRRAALADAADTALRRIGRDVRLALPNSTRVTTSGSSNFLEIMLVRTGGRYRSGTDPSATGTCPTGAGTAPSEDALLFGAADTCFKTVGSLPNIAQVTTSDYLVVFNLQPGSPNADAYQFPGTGGNKSLISGAVAGSGQDRITFASNTFSFESPGNRFFIIEGPVSFICDPVAKTLTRRWGYTISAAQPTSFSTGSSALLATGVTGCAFTYDTSIAAQDSGLVTLSLQLTVTDSTGTPATVNLYHAVHVNNVP